MKTPESVMKILQESVKIESRKIVTAEDLFKYVNRIVGDSLVRETYLDKVKKLLDE